MAYIYKITNDINQKIYIGKTEFSIEKRFREHCQDRLKENCKQRPLYRAMNKYGIEHFHIELLEQTENPEEREKYWIEYYGSFKYGYNATIGGDGKKYLDYELLISAYKELQSIKLVATQYNCDEYHLSKILKENNINVISSQEQNKKLYGQIINQYDLNGNYIQSFVSAHEAANSLNKKGVSHITDVCKGKRKTAYGYIWKYG